MPMTFLKNERNRLAFCFGRASALRSTSDVVEQLQQQVEQLHQQLECERRAHAFVVARMEEEAANLARRLAAAKLQLARRAVVDALAAAASPSEMIH